MSCQQIFDNPELNNELIMPQHSMAIGSEPSTHTVSAIVIHCAIPFRVFHIRLKWLMKLIERQPQEMIRCYSTVARFENLVRKCHLYQLILMTFSDKVSKKVSFTFFFWFVCIYKKKKNERIEYALFRVTSDHKVRWKWLRNLNAFSHFFRSITFLYQ